MNYYIRFFLLLIGLALPLQSFAGFGGPAHVQVKLVQEEETIQPGRPFWVAIHLNIEDDWHVYWKNPGDAGMPLKIEWKLPPGFEAGPLQWPFPEKFTVADMVGFGYKGEVVLLSMLSPPADLPSNQPIQLDAQVKWLVCSALTCQPGSAPVSIKVTSQDGMPQTSQEAVALFSNARAKMPTSHAEFKTVRKEGIVQIEVPNADQEPQSNNIVGVYFFPEQKDVIDHSVDPTVANHKTDNRYFVNLKGSDEIGAKSQILKGVLVVHTQQGAEENVQAFDIDTPIEEANDDLLSVLDHSSLSSNSIGIKSATASQTHATFEGGLALALVFAFVGGMILNLMPCVLPVMSFKVMSFIKMAGQSRSLTIKHGLMFSLGVILSFWALASAMLMLRAYGQAVGWGFQLQEPLFVIILASVLFIFALSLFGMFEWGMFFASWAGQTQAEKATQSAGFTGSFLSGVLATAVATPCTGPFLGSAVGFAVTLPVFQSLLIFTVLGLGMCFPYLLLAAFPSFLRFMPKPGAWMETFKELMGFILIATVLWLLWVFSAQTNTLSLICVLAGFLCFSIGAWVYGKGSTPLVSRRKRLLAYAFVALFMFAGIQAIIFPRASWYQDSSLAKGQKGEWQGWETFSPERVAELRKQGRPVLIDFTAKWCLICQANHMVLDSEDVEKRLADEGVVKMVADWTKNDPVITEELSKFGRNSVPLYVLYGKDEKQAPIILPQVLTTDVVTQHIDSAMNSEEVALTP
ncbi:putative thiol:disulfide interchange protein DsbD [Candidatus Protochlamydia naegleriophila]|uniref:Putative thiol:disulfide interchange protein DsbD n=1 Tax=Candidatus Protochlamydia naegleriophila TaxID=389348 RepID=A0A0U5EUD8_9BACT|nr:protein-disulfide reductase DsbD domain-containing protein [Candidatus Protochlamydia naegleriophila]CUI17809.1 putative thiol:disulfide interchange protein DsbD [Candidatus Protochlamydia naegleriophila]